jgi:ribosomal-protein-serine acetyltransferase
MFSYRVEKNIELRLPEPHHAPEIYSVVRQNLEHLQEWMPWATDSYSLETAQEYLRRNLLEFAEGKGFSASVVVEGKVVGQIGFHNLDWTNKSTQLGYWLTARAQGKGLMTKCCRVFINHAFDQLGLNRVQINCNVENLRSRAIPERLGFQKEGIYRQVEWLNGRFGDWVVYSMLAEEWKKQ